MPIEFALFFGLRNQHGHAVLRAAASSGGGSGSKAAAAAGAGQNGTQPTETAAQIQQNATAFINYLPTEKEYSQRKNTNGKSYEEYVVDKLESFLRDGRLTNAEALAAINYFNVK